MARLFTIVPQGWLVRLAAFVVFAAVSVVVAQQLPQSFVAAVNTASSSDADFKFVKRVDEVNLRFTVTDGGGHFKSKLSPTDFEVLDNHQPPASIHFFQQQSKLPMRVGILIDVSASVGAKFKFEQRAAKVFLEKVLRPGVDEAFIVSFDNRVHLLQDWTSDPKRALQKLHDLEAGGETAMYDAVVFAAEKLRRRNSEMVTRPVIILITDGDDNVSKSIMYDAQQAAVRAEAILFALSTNQVMPGVYPKGDAVLDLMSRATGGSILPAHEDSQLSHAFRQVEEALQAEYILGYQPAELKPDGSFRVVEIHPRLSKLRVHTRRGYYAPLESQDKSEF